MLRPLIDLIDNWHSDNPHADRMEVYRGHTGTTHITVMRWALDDCHGFVGFYSSKGYRAELVPDIAQYTFNCARVCWARRWMDPITRRQYDFLREKLADATCVPQMLQEATRRLDFVTTHCATQGVNADMRAVLNNIGKGLAALDIPMDMAF